MDIEAWFSIMPGHVVCEIARRKRELICGIYAPKAANFKNQYYIIKEILEMARKVKSERITDKSDISPSERAAKSDGKSRSQTRWAGCDIRSKEHKSAIRDLATNANFVLDTIVELVDEGYDLHIKRTDEGSTVRAMLFCHIENHINKSGGLSADAPDAWLSITALVYKHVHLLDGKWFDETTSNDEDDNWR